MKKELIQTLKILIAAVILSFGVSYAYAWVGPSAAPTGGNTSAPINVSATAQTKTGNLSTLGTLSANNGLFAGSITLGGVARSSWPSNNSIGGGMAIQYDRVNFVSRSLGFAYTDGWAVSDGLGGWYTRVYVYQDDGVLSCDTGWVSPSTGFASCFANQSSGWFVAPIGAYSTPTLRGYGYNGGTTWCGQSVTEYPILPDDFDNQSPCTSFTQWN